MVGSNLPGTRGPRLATLPFACQCHELALLCLASCEGISAELLTSAAWELHGPPMAPSISRNSSRWHELWQFGNLQMHRRVLRGSCQSGQLQSVQHSWRTCIGPCTASGGRGFPKHSASTAPRLRNRQISAQFFGVAHWACWCPPHFMVACRKRARRCAHARQFGSPKPEALSTSRGHV